MNSITIKTSSDIEKIEALRKEVFGLDMESSYYSDKLLNKKELAIATFDQEKIVAGVYVHAFESTLVIDQLFVKKEYQNTGLKLGRNLLNFLKENKELIEAFFDAKLNVMTIESKNEKARSIYAKSGFRESKRDNDVFYKSL